MVSLNSLASAAHLSKDFAMPRLGLAALLLLALSPAPAAAQSIPPEERPLDARRRAQNQPAAPNAVAATRADLIRGVACQLERDAASLDPMLASAPYSAGEAAETARILPLARECFGGRATFTTPPAALRGAIAEALYKARFAAPQPVRAPALGVKPLLDLAAATTRPDAATLAPAYAMAQCVAARHAGPALALLASEPGSPAEGAAFGTLGPAFGECATGGGNITVDGRTLRGILAESLYRWSVVQRDGPASPWAAPAAPATR